MSRHEDKRILSELSTAFSNPILFENIPIHIDTRIGGASITERSVSVEEFLRMSRLALQDAIAKGLDHAAYSPALQTKSIDNILMLGELKDAITENQLLLHYQPKVEISTGAIYGAEALIRWNHPERGSIPPGLFIPRAEKSTLINDVTDFALNQALLQIAAWQQQDINIQIAVNISTQNLLQPDFVEQIVRLLQHYGVAGEQLELEITEGTMVTDVKTTIAVLNRLAEEKITISIDDFGTGYSSMQYLHDLPISFIKIDQSFVRRLPFDKSAISICEATVQMAQKMGLQTIAEGVEDRQAYDCLAEMGCDFAQGFMIAKPQPAEQYKTWHMQNADCRLRLPPHATR